MTALLLSRFEMELLIYRFAAVSLLITGLSHLVQPRRWADFFHTLRQQPTTPFLIGVLSLPLALLVVLGHNVWVWDWPVAVTLFGWLLLTKCVVYLLYPAAFKTVSPEHHATFQRSFVAVGAVMTVLGGVLSYDAFLG